jgi:hypothetical protein
MKKFLALTIITLTTVVFAAPAMADAVVVSPNGVGIVTPHHDHDRNRDDRNIHGDHDVDHNHHADRGE